MSKPNPFAEKERAIRSALQAQGFFRLLGAEIDEVAPGSCTLAVSKRPELLQQNGLYHGGLIAFLVDNTTTAAAGTLSDIDRSVLTAEYKLNILAPASGERLICRAEVVKPGRMLTVVEGRVWSEQAGSRKLVAIGLATIANISREREDRLRHAAAAAAG